MSGTEKFRLASCVTSSRSFLLLTGSSTYPPGLLIFSASCCRSLASVCRQPESAMGCLGMHVGQFQDCRL